MNKLLKYEFVKRKRFTFGYLILVVVLTLSAISNLYLYQGKMAPLAAVISVLIIILPLIYVFLSSVIDYYSDFVGQQRLMLFSIPESGYKITGAKYLYCFIEFVIFGLISVGMVTIINYVAAVAGFENIYNLIIDGIRNISQYTQGQLTTGNLIVLLILFVLLLIIQTFFTITTANLSITLSTTLLTNKKISWLLAIAAYMVISFVIKAILALPTIVIFRNDSFNDMNLIIGFLIFTAVGYTVFTVAEYFASALLIDKKLDL